MAPQRGDLYMLVDSGGHSLARVMLLAGQTGRYFQARIVKWLSGDGLLRREAQMVPADGGAGGYLTRVVEEREGCVVLEVLRPLRRELRQNVRVEVEFPAPIYPLTGGWQGRRWVDVANLSCGGVAFHAAQALAVGEQLEIVVPVTDEPLVLPFEVLRNGPGADLCAGQFVELCHDQEALVRKAVFSIQLDQQRAGRPATQDIQED